MIVGTNDDIEFSDWVSVESPKIKDDFFLINEQLKKIDISLKAAQNFWWGREQAIKTTEDKLGQCITELKKINHLNENDKKELLPIFASAYKTLGVLSRNNFLSTKIINEITTEKVKIQQKCFGIADELNQIYALAQVAEEFIEKQRSEEYLIEIKNEEPCLIEKKYASKTDAELTFNYLKGVLNALNNEKVIQRLPVNDLMKLKTLASWMMVNYVNAQQLKLDLVEHIYPKFKEINALVEQELLKRPKGEYAKDFSDQIPAKLIALKEHLASACYFKDFWHDGQHFEKLKECEQCLAFCQQFLSDTTSVNLDGLVFLKKDDAAGVALYEKSQDESNEKVLFLFAFGREGILPYYNYLQSRKSNLGMGGLGHIAVYDAVEQSWSALPELFQSASVDLKSIKKIISTGFGIDGAVAQVLSFLLAKKYGHLETCAYGIGVAPYLDKNAAATVSEQKNHYAVNFTLEGDRQLQVSALSKYVANIYSTQNYSASYPLYNRDWFVSDVTGHDRGIYVEKVEPGIKQPIELQELYIKLANLAIEIGQTSEVSDAVYKHLQSKKS